MIVRIFRRGLAAAALLVVFQVGCANQASKIILPPAADNELSRQSADVVHVVASDPRAFLERVAKNAGELSQYTVQFTRTERRGLLKALQGPEKIVCWYRRKPLSIRMKWVDPDVKYGESAYTAGSDADRVRFVPRNGFLGLAPAVTTVDVQTPVTWGESRYPITDFGLARMMERALDSMTRAGDELKIEYRGLTRLPETQRVVHSFHMEFPRAKFPVPVLELFVDRDTELPAGTIMRTASGELDATYWYADLRTDVKLAEGDFLMDAERSAKGGSGKQASAAQ